MYHAAAYIHDEISLYNASKAMAGLLELAELGEITLRLTDRGFAAPHPAVFQLTVAEDDGEPRRAAIDLLDRSDVVDFATLASCDVYFKRSYFQADLAKLSQQSWLRPQTAKIRPWGLNFPCLVPALKSRRWKLLARCFWKRSLRALVRGPQAARAVAQEMRQFACLPAAAQFEADPGEPLEPIVVFQTRLWEPHEAAPDDAAAVNRMRVEVVRALRQALSTAFVGGLVSTPLARREHPGEVVPPQQSRMVNYAALSRRALIGVYTRGLHHSTAFKLPEYLAGSKAVVAEGLRNQTPTPLERGLHWAEFRDADECVLECRRLLADHERCAAMRQASAEYYRLHVAPQAHLRWTLAEACAARPASAAAPRLVTQEPELARSL